VTIRPDLTNSDEHIPLVLQQLAGAIGEAARRREEAERRRKAEEDALGELMIRRLANRHDHRRLPCRSGGWHEVCPDPQAHAADAAAMATVLEACGFIPYEHGRPDITPDGCRRTITNYQRPGR
jgi:hypothetical protein